MKILLDGNVHICFNFGSAIAATKEIILTHIHRQLPARTSVVTHLKAFVEHFHLDFEMFLIDINSRFIERLSQDLC